MPPMPEAGDLVRSDRLGEAVAKIYEKAENMFESGRYAVCYAASITQYAVEVWQKTDNFDDASEMVPALIVFLLTLTCVKTAKVWFEDRFNDDGTPRTEPVVWGVCPGNVRRETYPGEPGAVPAAAWDMLPLTRDELRDSLKEPVKSTTGKRTLDKEDESEAVAAPAPAPALTGLDAVRAGGFDAESVPLFPQAKVLAENIRQSLFPA